MRKLFIPLLSLVMLLGACRTLQHRSAKGLDIVKLLISDHVPTEYQDYTEIRGSLDYGTRFVVYMEFQGMDVREDAGVRYIWIIIEGELIGPQGSVLSEGEMINYNGPLQPDKDTNEMYFYQGLVIPKGIEPGTYTIIITVRDLYADASATKSVTFNVKATKEC